MTGIGCTGRLDCICRGTGTIEEGPAGATYSVPCPGPPDRIWSGQMYVATRITPSPDSPS